MVQRRPLRRQDYTVGLICALDTELAAVQEMLDEEHEDLEQDGHDNNLYSLGRIGDHNVVIVCLPSGLMGNNPAATVATQMRSTFRSVRFCMMVGVGGGVPSGEADIRLGDVVVSQPHQGYGGVIQYDFGKATPNGFRRTGFLNSSPPVLLGAVNKVRANHLRGRGRISEHLARLDSLPHFRREAAGPDILFDAAYNHQGGPSCRLCKLDRRVDRPPRGHDNPVVHYGTIASANQVMRDAAQRDMISAEFGNVLCFEMEAAGLMIGFPCLVVRGICDYSDSHKNDRWQAYAAGAAAAYAKEVLLVIPRAEVAHSTPTSMNVESSVNPPPPLRTDPRSSTQGFSPRYPPDTTNRHLTPGTPPDLCSGEFFASPESLCRAIQRDDLERVQVLLASCVDSAEMLLAPVVATGEPWYVSRWREYWGIPSLERRTTALHCAVEAAGNHSLAILRALLSALPWRLIDAVGYVSLVDSINASERARGKIMLAPDSVGGHMQTCTPLAWAAILGNAMAIRMLKDARADLNSRANWLRVTPLMAHCFLTVAPSAGDATGSLLGGGAFLDLQDDLGNTALHLALFARNSDIAMALLDAGASVVLPNLNGFRQCDIARTIDGIPQQVQLAIRSRTPLFARSFGY
ncbi:nucleoside phosphorylase domain-containing protein [Emericellopsis cladophorae]|uniref:Nucleoside phosphorylase domain-containing protein n=1 Tax=Emericellopsis cladophorae TaxID=2686198 RepID=A0A9P9Y4R5_9HYPO|nr:nucleoside phosphorylase domain-containing protein [Emericellopsis cladophorae]KAI6783325.1 nucleoside phosphorylase domain-containing protein [Emericellopsis cladophorae]